MRLYIFLPILLIMAIPAGFQGCQLPSMNKPVVNVSNSTNITKAPETITLASFNIQIFGQDKMSDQEVVSILKQIVKRYDIVMIQEIRDESGQTIPEFVRQINDMPGSKYLYVISDRLGDSTSKEQYAILYRNDTLTLDGTRLFPDIKNFFEREPFSAKFSVIGGNLDFVAMDVHVQPSNATSEIDDLHYPMEDARDYFNEKDVILGGDLNSDCSYWNEGGQSTMRNQQYYWVIPDSADTTVRANQCTYDRFIFYQTYTTEDYTGEWGIFNFQQEYGLNEDLAYKVSDHFPIWMKLYTNKDTN